MSGRFARNSAYGTLAGLGTALGSFLSMVIVARMLGPAGTGTVAYALWIVTLAATFADIGLTQTLARYVPELTAAGDGDAAAAMAATLLRIGALAAIFGSAAFVLGGFAAVREGAILQGSDWWWVGLLFLLQFASALGLATLRGFQRFDIAAKLTLGSLALQLTAVTIGGLLHGVPGILAGYCAGSLLPIGAALIHAAGRPRIAAVLRRRILRFAVYSWAGALTLSLVWSRVEIYFLERYWGGEAVALFTIGFTFSNLASQGPLLLTGGLLPYFAASRGRSGIGQMHEVYATATRVMAFLLFPACFGLAAILPALLPLVYGPSFAEAVPVGCILVAGAAIGASGAVGSHLIYAHERSDFIFLSGAVGAALTLAAGFLVTPVFGMIGAALARVAIHAFMVAYGTWFVSRRLNCPTPLASLAKLLLAATLASLVAFAIVRTVHAPLVALPLAIAAAAIVYAASVRTLQALPAQDVVRLRTLAGRLPRPARGPTDGLLALLAPRTA